MNDQNQGADGNPEAPQKKLSPLAMLLLPFALLAVGIREPFIALYKATYSRGDGGRDDNASRATWAIWLAVGAGIARAVALAYAHQSPAVWLTASLGTAVGTFLVLFPLYYIGLFRPARKLGGIVYDKDINGPDESLITKIQMKIAEICIVSASAYTGWTIFHSIAGTGESGAMGIVMGVGVGLLAFVLLWQIALAMLNGLGLIAISAVFTYLACQLLTPAIMLVNYGYDVLAGLYLLSATATYGIVYPAINLFLNKYAGKIVEKLDQVRKNVYKLEETPFKLLVLHATNLLVTYGLTSALASRLQQSAMADHQIVMSLVEGVVAFSCYLTVGRLLQTKSFSLWGFEINGLSLLGLTTGAAVGSLVSLIGSHLTTVGAAVFLGIVAFALTTAWVFPVGFAAATMLASALSPVTKFLSTLLNNMHKYAFQAYTTALETANQLLKTVEQAWSTAYKEVLNEIDRIFNKNKKKEEEPKEKEMQ